MPIPQYPNRAPISLSMREELHPLLVDIPDGVSEFSFAGLYLFRATYQYQVSWLPQHKLLIAGTKDGHNFAALPLGLPDDSDLCSRLVQDFEYFKGFSQTSIVGARPWFEAHEFEVHEDRDNFDYLYRRADLVDLPGKKFHKKRNLVNQFLNHYSHTEATLTDQNKADAYAILEAWRAAHDDDADYASCKEALDLMHQLDLEGHIVYAEGRPAAYSMGEPLAAGSAFVIHVEKADPHFKGIYQFINQAHAAALQEAYAHINREQDLGDPGLRQAKMTYRPCCFVKKFRVVPRGRHDLLSRGLAYDGQAEDVAV